MLPILRNTNNWYGKQFQENYWIINWWRLHHKPISAQINSLITFLEDLITNFYILLVLYVILYEFTNKLW